MAISKIILNGVTQMDLTADTVAANNLIAPNTAHGADGEPITGTASSGSSAWTKVAETSYQVSTTETGSREVATWTTGHSEIWTSSKWVYVRIRDTAGKRNGYFYGSDQFFFNLIPINGQQGISTNTSMRTCIRYSNNVFNTITTIDASGYGVFADQISSSGGIRIKRRYNGTNSLTINGTYKVEVYLLDPPTGAPIFT